MHKVSSCNKSKGKGKRLVELLAALVKLQMLELVVKFQSESSPEYVPLHMFVTQASMA